MEGAKEGGEVCGNAHSSSQKSYSSDDIAIVGIGCRTPGADNIREFWRVLQNGECHITDVPPGRWNAAAFLDSDPLAPGKSYVQKGGFIKDVESFDNTLYGINDYEASQMDPQQCLLLECTTMALEDAGITSERLSGSNTGVYVGSMNNDHGRKFWGKTTKNDNYTATGVSNTILASRLSFSLHLTGPCMVLDTGCSASLVAVHQGCQAIRSGDCDMAICGGVNCMLTPDMFVMLSKARMISPTGLCHTFSDKADGYTRGEGCGIVILKRLSDAIRDGDNIRATVYTGTNQDGHAVIPMTAPSGEQQKKLLHHVYDKFHIDVSELDYIEAHGTGTPAGDPVEVNSLGLFFKEKGPSRERHIGSVKTNIGHTESAAGILGLIKILLMMERSMIVPSLHCEVVNPKIDLSGYRFVVPKETVPWNKPQKVAACNSFGFGGSNSHAVVRSYTGQDLDQSPRENCQCIVCFSGKTHKALKNSLYDFYNDEETLVLDIQNISYTSTARRDHHPFRAAFIVEGVDDLRAAVEDHLSRDKWAAPVSAHLNIIFVFCGMGTAWDGMCRQLMEENKVFRDAILEVEKQLSVFVPWSLTRRLREEDPTKDVLLTPIAIFACQVGIVAVWRSMGVQPDCVLGQSIGEVAAAHTAGCLTLQEAVKIVYHRSKLLEEATGGAMMVVRNMDVNKVHEVVRKMKDKASIALEYSPRACAISADPETMQTLRSELKSAREDTKLVSLDVHVAYHSFYVSKAAEKLEKAITEINPKVPELPFVSTVTGHIVTFPVTPDYWVDNVKKPVLFHQAVTESVSSKTDTTVFLEIGPTPVLQAHMPDLFPDGQHKAVASVNRQSEMKCLKQSIGELYERGAVINWWNLPTSGTHVATVPRYSFDRKHLREETEQQIVQYNGCNQYRKKHLYVYPSEVCPESFLVMLSPLTIPSVYQHVVMGNIIVPGALYAECGFAVAKSCYSHTNVSVSVEFQQILPLRKDQVVGLEIRPTGSTSNATEKEFVICWKERKLAVVHVKETGIRARELFNLTTISSKCADEVDKTDIYIALKKFGFEYGPAMSMLKHAYRNSSECLATLELHETVISEMADTVIHPCVLDCMMQSTVLLLGNNEMALKEMLPKSVSGVVVIRSMEQVMCVHAKLKFRSSGAFVFEIQLLTADGHVIVELRDFTMQTLTQSQEDTTLPNMLNVQWNKIKNVSFDTFARDVQQRQQNVLLINDEDSYVNYFTVDTNSATQAIKSDLENLLMTQEIETIAVIVPKADFTAYGGDTAQSLLIDYCLLLQTLLKTLNERSVHVPVFLLTFSAWPCPTGSQVGDVDPVATALWGLLRTVIDEHVYPCLAAVDVHIEDFNSESLQRLVKHLMTDEDLANYPEILITENSIYVNQIVESSWSAISVPEKRQNLPVRIGDLSDGAIVLSKDAFRLDRLSAVSQEAASVSKQNGLLKALTFALPPEQLFSTEVPSTYVLPDKMGQSSYYVVMALEVTGHIKEAPDQQLTSCGPLTVCSELSVCKDCTVATTSLPDYKPGDLCRLVLFWSLVNKVPTKRFSVLASSDTKHLAEIVKLLSCHASKREDSDVNVILIENMKDDTNCHESVMSLILLDVDTMSLMARGWKNTHNLISLSCLVTKGMQAYLAYILPDSQLCLLDTQLLFQMCRLKKVVPNLRNWVQENKALMSLVSQHLHSTGNAERNVGIHGLLQFRALNLSALEVQLVSDKLFQRDGAYMVVGGLTGLGWLCVEFLAQNNAGFIAIVNRRAPSDEQTADIRNLSQRFGCQIQSYQGDVSSMKSLQEILNLMSDEWSPKGQLRGVFIGAAVVQGSFFPTMARSAFEYVLTPKVKGTWNLHQLTKNMPLDYFVMHSSVISVLGYLGQVNYSTGNAFLDGLSFHRRYLGLAAQTINWGPLDTGLLDNKDLIKQRFDSWGLLLRSKQEIKEILPVLMKLNWTQSVPVNLNREKFAKRIGGTPSQSLLKRFQHLVSVSSLGEANGAAHDPDKVDKIRFQPSPDRLQAYERFVQKLTTRILSVDIALVTRDVNLYDLGLDSVTGMMMINIIERSTSFRLSAVSLLSGEVTVAFLAHTLDEFASNSVAKDNSE